MRRRLVVVVALVVGAAALLVPVSARPALDISMRPGVLRLLDRVAEGVRSRAIVTLDAPATAPLVRRLGLLGLSVQPLSELPMAIVAGTTAQLLQAVRTGLVRDVYPDEPVQLHSDESTARMRADIPRAAGFTGKGITVAVIDSGIDATNPDLADHVVHNMKLVGAEYLNAAPGLATLVVPTDSLPLNNSDLGSGHGTHVAGIIAADGTSGPELIGVAPDADLIGISIGEVLFTTAVVSGFDQVLAHPEWGVDVINNSWGNAFTFLDLAHPVHVATRALADRGVVVVFSAGNSGGPMSLNEWSVAPWVISVGNATVEQERASSSSRGMPYDNLRGAVSVPAGGHATVDGDEIGEYHPDVMAPGSDILSTAALTGLLVGPGRSAIASGTSMASPHVAGAAAVLLQARPTLTPTQIREVLEVTARPLQTGESKAFWEVGYGNVDLAAALDLVARPSFDAELLAILKAGADSRVQRARAWRVLRGDYFNWKASLVSVAGIPDTFVESIEVPAGTQGLQVSVAFPSLATVGGNIFYEYAATVYDAAGTVVARTGAPDLQSGFTQAAVDLTQLASAPKFGEWRVEVTGFVSVADPDTLDSDSVQGRRVSLAIHSLVKP
jgi:serine protease AprX